MNNVVEVAYKTMSCQTLTFIGKIKNPAKLPTMGTWVMDLKFPSQSNVTRNWPSISLSAIKPSGHAAIFAD